MAFESVKIIREISNQIFLCLSLFIFFGTNQSNFNWFIVLKLWAIDYWLSNICTLVCTNVGSSNDNFSHAIKLVGKIPQHQWINQRKKKFVFNFVNFIIFGAVANEHKVTIQFTGIPFSLYFFAYPLKVRGKYWNRLKKSML